MEMLFAIRLSRWSWRCIKLICNDQISHDCWYNLNNLSSDSDPQTISTALTASRIFQLILNKVLRTFRSRDLICDRKFARETALSFDLVMSRPTTTDVCSASLVTELPAWIMRKMMKYCRNDKTAGAIRLVRESFETFISSRTNSNAHKMLINWFEKKLLDEIEDVDEKSLPDSWSSRKSNEKRTLSWQLRFRRTSRGRDLLNV